MMGKLLLMIILITGCGASVKPNLQKIADGLCLDNGGTAYLWVKSLSYEIDVYCKNGAVFSGVPTREEVTNDK